MPTRVYHLNPAVPRAMGTLPATIELHQDGSRSFLWIGDENPGDACYGTMASEDLRGFAHDILAALDGKKKRKGK